MKKVLLIALLALTACQKEQELEAVNVAEGRDCGLVDKSLNVDLADIYEDKILLTVSTFNCSTSDFVPVLKESDYLKFTFDNKIITLRYDAAKSHRAHWCGWWFYIDSSDDLDLIEQWEEDNSQTQLAGYLKFNAFECNE